MKTAVIIDTDPGIDDALAIMLAVKSAKLDIKAITTVAGNVTITNTTRNARYILDLLGEKDIPVFSGEKKPLERESYKISVHGKRGLGGVAPQNKPKLTGNAPEKIIEVVEKNKNITLISLGPLTNVARAIEKNPEAMKKVKKLVMMGGAIKPPGNVNRVAEFNIFFDPEAAEKVFSFPIKKHLIPMDVCNRALFSYEDFKKLEKNKLHEFTRKMVKFYFSFVLKKNKKKRAPIYDPLAVYYLLNPSAFKTKKEDIKIETEGLLTRGMMVLEKRDMWKIYNTTVAEEIDKSTFKKDFFRILNS